MLSVGRRQTIWRPPYVGLRPWTLITELWLCIHRRLTTGNRSLTGPVIVRSPVIYRSGHRSEEEVVHHHRTILLLLRRKTHHRQRAVTIDTTG
ncbi:hypothetical protein DPMN_013023 [Dreissena polymorpha]|uniref:Uncharacterized protein n=1 Tax=Dreissena polymorpha TaxID=45954 RepID=A0A9D4N3I8_DREPO|nr:hypothetical protein DPMN_013023 [Dreissena polymorpha]